MVTPSEVFTLYTDQSSFTRQHIPKQWVPAEHATLMRERASGNVERAYGLSFPATNYPDGTDGFL